jgi:K+-sensing histidine kinase KdpD
MAMDAKNEKATSFGTSIRAWKTICCAVDLFHDPTAIMEAAAELCRLLGANLILFHAAGRRFTPYPGAVSPGCDRELGYWAERARAFGVRHVTVEVSVDEPADALVRFARENNVDAIVMGARTTNRIAHAFHKSVVERVARGASCPVLVFRKTSMEHARPTTQASPPSAKPVRPPHLYLVK